MRFVSLDIIISKQINILFNRLLSLISDLKIKQISIFFSKDIS